MAADSGCAPVYFSSPLGPERLHFAFGMKASTRRQSGMLLWLIPTVCLAVAAVVWPRPCPVRVRVLDPRFCALSVKVLHSTKEPFYLGNQTEGRVRDFLRQRFHLSIIKPLPNVAPMGRGQLMSLFQPVNHCTFALRFSLKNNQSSAPVKAELRDASGDFVPIAGAEWGGTNPDYVLLDLDTFRTYGGNFTLRLTQRAVCLAEIELKNLPSVPQKVFHVGPNAF